MEVDSVSFEDRVNFVRSRQIGAFLKFVFGTGNFRRTGERPVVILGCHMSKLFSVCSLENCPKANFDMLG